MQKNVLPLGTTLLGIVLGPVGGMLTHSLTVVTAGALLSAVGAIWAYRVRKPFVLAFSSANWTPQGHEWLLSIPARMHGRGKDVTTTVYLKSGASYEVVFADVHPDADGNLTIRIAVEPFVGKVVVN